VPAFELRRVEDDGGTGIPPQTGPRREGDADESGDALRAAPRRLSPVPPWPALRRPRSTRFFQVTRSLSASCSGVGGPCDATGMTPIQRIRPQGLISSPAFSHVAIVPPGATTIYVGGQNAVDADGSLIGEGDVAVQSARALENAKTALAAAGATLGDVVHWTVLFVDGVDLAAGYGAIASELASDEPALVTGARVAGLGVPGALVEISAVAAVLR
jgi:enamine deaminase RidA (YjgF/YER057c/UK114 family)